MIGFNGGLIGKARSYATSGANSGVWTLQEQSIASAAFAIGGAETTIDVGGVNYRVHTFTTPGTLTVFKSVSVDYLVVAGGGGGGRTNRAGGGGGAGGVRTGTAFSLTPGPITVTVGMEALQPRLPQLTEAKGKIQYFPQSRQQAAVLVVDCLTQRVADLVDLAVAVATKDMELEVLATPLQHLRHKEIMVGRATEDLHSKVVEVEVQGQQEQPVALVPMAASASKVL
jgi:hypothetical protein